MKFQHFEIRPCLEQGGSTHSFLGEPVHVPSIGDDVFTTEGALAAARAFRAKHDDAGEIFWTLYGKDTEGLAHAIGNFTSFDATLEIMNAILAPMAEARDVLDAGSRFSADTGHLSDRVRDASSALEDFINQCPNTDRL